MTGDLRRFEAEIEIVGHEESEAEAKKKADEARERRARR